MMVAQEEVVMSEPMVEEQGISCGEKDWNCMLENYYKGYLLFVEAVVEKGKDEEGNPIYEVYAVDVTGMENEEIEGVIRDMKAVYPDVVEVRVHFCGNHIGKLCKLIRV